MKYPISILSCLIWVPRPQKHEHINTDYKSSLRVLNGKSFILFMLFGAFIKLDAFLHESFVCVTIFTRGKQVDIILPFWKLKYCVGLERICKLLCFELHDFINKHTENEPFGVYCFLILVL